MMIESNNICVYRRLIFPNIQRKLTQKWYFFESHNDTM